MSKILILVYTNGAHWGIPLDRIATNRAKYYAAKDVDTTYQEEYDFVMKDDYEAKDWFFNNMNWDEVEDVAFEISPPAKFDPSDLDLLNDSYFGEK